MERALSQEKKGMQPEGGNGSRKRRTWKQKKEVMEVRKGELGGRKGG